MLSYPTMTKSHVPLNQLCISLGTVGGKRITGGNTRNDSQEEFARSPNARKFAFS